MVADDFNKKSDAFRKNKELDRCSIDATTINIIRKFHIKAQYTSQEIAEIHCISIETAHKLVVEDSYP